jgi:hypothetical protein
MNAYKLREEAIGGAVRSMTGKLVEVGEGGARSVGVKVGVEVSACKIDITASGWEAFAVA